MAGCRKSLGNSAELSTLKKGIKVQYKQDTQIHFSQIDNFISSR